MFPTTFQKIFVRFNLILLFVFVFTSQELLAQDKLTYERFNNFLNQSKSVVLNDSISLQIDNFINLYKVDKRIVEKNTIFLKAAFNETIAINDRIAICDNILHNFNTENKQFPIEIIENLKKQLIEK